MRTKISAASPSILLSAPGSILALNFISDKANVPIAAVPANRPRVFHNASFQFLPPFVSGPFLEFKDKDPVQLLVELNSIISAHDIAHDTDDTFPSTAEHCKYLRSFLWACATGAIDPLKCSPDSDNIELAKLLHLPVINS